MTEAQIQLQNALTTTFFANLAFLSEYDSELYHRVDELSRLIENGSYKEKYTLEFIMESGDFDIYDIVNDKYMYSKKPKKINEQLINDIQFDEKNAILNLSPEFIIKEKSNVNIEERFDFKEIVQFNALVQNDMWEYANSLDDFLEDTSRKLIKIHKFIFLGTLLGRHIPAIAEKVDAKMYLVLEKNLEIFRLSLFTVDYTVLAKKGVIFSIMDEQVNLDKKISNFLELDYIDNNLLKLSTTNINIDNFIDTILSHLLMSDPGIYNYRRNLYVYINRTINNMIKHRILIFDKLKEKCSLFNDLPILYCAAGPSLDDNIDWIKKNQDKFFIVTIGAAYKKLLDNDIRIDMITTLDEQELLSSMQFNDEDIKRISKETIILASCITSEKVLDKLSSHNLYLYEIFSSFYKDNKSFSGFSIGEITVDILLQMNPKEIYLVGLDLALNQKTGETHSKNSGSGSTSVDLNTIQNRNTFDFRESLVKVKGNYHKEVFTTAVFFSSIKDLESKLEKYKGETKIFNLSENGAFFEGTITKNIREIDIKKASFNNKELMMLLEQNSKQGIPSEIKDEFDNEISFIEDVLKDSFNEDFDFKTFSEFLHFMDKIIVPIYKKRYLNLYRLINSYLGILIPYLKFHFNNKKLKDEQKKVEEIKKIFKKQLLDILDDYIFCLKKN